MIEQKDWELVNLGLPAMPGLGIVTFRQTDGSFKPRIIAQPNGAIAYSAAWCDQAGEIKEWLDLWIQDTSSWYLDPSSRILAVTNPALDRHWTEWCLGMTNAHPSLVFNLGFEQHSAPVLWLAADGLSLLDTDTTWLLCTDDDVLRKNRLAGYSDSLHRYLWNQDAKSPLFIATTPDAPEGPMTRQSSEVFADAIPINPAGSLMALRRSFALPLSDFIDIISNRSDPRNIREAIRNPIGGSNLQLIEKSGIGGRNPGFFFQKNQAAGHLCELFHLKLAALHGAFVSAANAVQQSSSPFFGLNIDGFGVSLPELTTSLPFLWGHQVSLQSPPQCIRTLVGDISEPCFLPYPGLHQSIYRSPRVLTEISGSARVRIRNVSEPDDDGLVVMEGTLVSEETIHAGRLDLLGLEWVLPKLGRICLYAKIEGKSGESLGEYRFCTLQTKLSNEVKTWLDSGKNTLSSDRISFHLLPRIGTPCDLYSMGVIALRVLIQHPDGLAATIDNLLSLARKYRNRFSDANWVTGTASLLEFAKTGEAGPISERLGPQWIISNSDVTSTDAFSEIPAQLWWDTIDFISRLFPGEALGSFCKDHDDFQPRALHDVFVAPIAALESLLGRSRELLFGNPNSNRELLNAIRQAKASG